MYALRVLSAAAIAAFVLPFASASVWSTTAQYGQYDFGNGYAVNNDIWGASPGSQTLYVDTLSGSAPHFWASATYSGSGVKSYPDARITINKSVSALSRLVGTFDTGAVQGTCDFSFDCWVQPSSGSKYEVMVWTQWSSNQYPAGHSAGVQATVTLSGVTYNVYKGVITNSSGSTWNCWSFLRTSQAATGSADLAAVFKWLVNTGREHDGTVGSCQYGIEIINGSSTWTVHSCSITQ
jgi:hypothetical protein